MNILNRLFGKKISKENIHAHEVVDQKAGEAHDILNEVQSKLIQITLEIENDRQRSNKDLANKVKTLRDVAQQIAVVSGSIKK